jgi:hypothetical protein
MKIKSKNKNFIFFIKFLFQINLISCINSNKENKNIPENEIITQNKKEENKQEILYTPEGIEFGNKLNDENKNISETENISQNGIITNQKDEKILNTHQEIKFENKLIKKEEESDEANKITITTSYIENSNNQGTIIYVRPGLNFFVINNKDKKLKNITTIKEFIRIYVAHEYVNYIKHYFSEGIIFLKIGVSTTPLYEYNCEFQKIEVKNEYIFIYVYKEIKEISFSPKDKDINMFFRVHMFLSDINHIRDTMLLFFFIIFPEYEEAEKQNKDILAYIIKTEAIKKLKDKIEEIHKESYPYETKLPNSELELFYKKIKDSLSFLETTSLLEKDSKNSMTEAILEFKEFSKKPHPFHKFIFNFLGKTSGSLNQYTMINIFIAYIFLFLDKKDEIFFNLSFDVCCFKKILFTKEQNLFLEGLLSNFENFSKNSESESESESNNMKNIVTYLELKLKDVPHYLLFRGMHIDKTDISKKYCVINSMLSTSLSPEIARQFAKNCIIIFIMPGDIDKNERLLNVNSLLNSSPEEEEIIIFDFGSIWKCFQNFKIAGFISVIFAYQVDDKELEIEKEDCFGVPINFEKFGADQIF